MSGGHKVRIRLRYANEGKTPWKWCGDCACGWGCMSWAWARENGSGTLGMALEHLTETAAGVTP